MREVSGMDDRLENTIAELRLGYFLQLYYDIQKKPMPKQLDLLNIWFGDLIIRVRETDGISKEDPEYIDTERMIYASRYHHYLYSGGNNRVTYITGKLVGTAKSNLEKERKTAEIIQKGIARKFIDDMDALSDWRDHIDNILSGLYENQLSDLHHSFYMFCVRAAEKHYEKDEYDRDRELYSFDDEVFDQIIYNAFYQLQRFEYDGLLYAFMWLLLGCLLRNECGRLCRTFDSSFAPIYKIPSETGHLLDKLWYLAEPEAYEPYYKGEDVQNRFPGIEWYCDQCGAHLNEQPGFDDHLNQWQCRKCGHINSISFDEIYENEEDFDNGIQRETEEDFNKAIERRKKELKKK